MSKKIIKVIGVNEFGIPVIGEPYGYVLQIDGATYSLGILLTKEGANERAPLDAKNMDCNVVLA